MPTGTDPPGFARAGFHYGHSGNTLAAVTARPGFELLLQPELSVVLFRRTGWSAEAYHAWSASRAKAGVALLVL